MSYLETGFLIGLLLGLSHTGAIAIGLVIGAAAGCVIGWLWAVYDWKKIIERAGL